VTKINIKDIADEILADGYLRKEGYPNSIVTDCNPGGKIHICEVRKGKQRSLFSLSLEDSHNAYVRKILSELVKTYNRRGVDRNE